ncbi:MAG: glycosyltransferase family 2 protein [Pseudomonadota bacterium]
MKDVHSIFHKSRAAEFRAVNDMFIGLPVYNGEAFLRDALSSICRQTYGSFELLVADNASTDLTESIAREFAAADTRIKYHRHERNLGAAPNFNYCADLATGKYFKWMSHDDVCEPTYLERCIALLEADPGAVVAHAHVLRIDEAGQEICSYERERDINHIDPVVRFARAMALDHGCVSVFGVIRLDILRNTSAIAPFIGSDRPLLAELALYGRFEYVPEPLFLWRSHESQSVRLNRHERAVWFSSDTRIISAISSRRTRELLEYQKIALRAKTPTAIKLRALLETLRWIHRYWHWFLTDLRATASALLRR